MKHPTEYKAWDKLVKHPLVKSAWVETNGAAQRYYDIWVELVDGYEIDGCETWVEDTFQAIFKALILARRVPVIQKLNHTKCPWKVDIKTESIAIYSADEKINCMLNETGKAIAYQSGQGIQENPDSYKPVTELQKVNFNRIVDCVNACDGMQSPQEAINELKEACKKGLKIYKRANPFTGSGQWEKMEDIVNILGQALQKTEK